MIARLYLTCGRYWDHIWLETMYVPLAMGCLVYGRYSVLARGRLLGTVLGNLKYLRKLLSQSVCKSKKLGSLPVPDHDSRFLVPLLQYSSLPLLKKQGRAAHSTVESSLLTLHQSWRGSPGSTVERTPWRTTVPSQHCLKRC